MRCGLRAKAVTAAAVLMLTAAGLGGCAAANADELASNAVQAIVRAERIDFQGESRSELDGYVLPPQPAVEGRMAAGKLVLLGYRSRGAEPSADMPNADVPAPVRWNLQSWLARYDEMKGDANINHELSDGSARVVTVQLDSGEVKKLVQSELLAHRDAVQQRAAAALATAPRGLTPAQEAQRRAELQTLAGRQSARLSEMLGSLRADGEMTFWIDRDRDRPVKLSLGTTLHYVSEGRQRTETAHSVYSFGEQGGDQLLPAS